MKLYAPGTQIKIHLTGFTGFITGVTFRECGVTYEVTYWDNKQDTEDMGMYYAFEFEAIAQFHELIIMKAPMEESLEGIG